MKRSTSILSAILTSLLPVGGALGQEVRTAPRAPMVLDLAPDGAPERSPGLDPIILESLEVGDRLRVRLPRSTGTRAVGKPVEFRLDALSRPDERRVHWTLTEVGGRLGHAQFVCLEGVLAGSLHAADGRAWRVLRDLDGTLRTEDLATTPSPRRAERAGVRPTPAPAPRTRVPDATPTPRSLPVAGTGTCSTPCQTRFIDIAVFYTAFAALGAGGDQSLEALIDLAVLQANTAFDNSDSTVQVRVVGFDQVDYDDATQVGHLASFSNPADGLMDEVPGRMVQLGADLATLVVEFDEGACGEADFYPGRYSLCTRFCLGSFVLAQGVGRNLGACHADSDPGCGSDLDFLLPQARAYRFTGTSGSLWRTVMAFNPGVVIPYFSNPDIEFDGVPIGIVAGPDGGADNVSVMETFAPVVEEFACAPQLPQTLKLLSDVQDDFDQFGLNVLLAREQVVVAALSADDAADDSGAVFAFEEISTANCSGAPVYGADRDTCYRQSGKLPIPDLREDDVFGFSLAGDDQTLVAGAPLRDNPASGGGPTQAQAGSIFVFELANDGLSWCFETELTSSTPGAERRFGGTVAFDGSTILAGSASPSGVGQVEWFRRVAGAWEIAGVLSGEDNESFALGEDAGFGEAIAISGDHLAIGAPRANGGAGAILLYERSGFAADWQLTQVLLGTPILSSVGTALSMDGDRLLIGCPESFSGSGTVFIYRYDGIQWVFEQRLNPTLAAESQAAFGSSVSIDGDRIAVGAPLARVDGFEEAGLVFLISYLDRLDSWFVAELVTAFDPEENKRYGSSVDLRGDLVAIGAVGDTEGGVQTGAAYIERFQPLVDCNENGYNDVYEVSQGIEVDINGDGLPDACNCFGDYNVDELINGVDLTLLLANWQASDPSIVTYFDLSGDGEIDGADIGYLLGRWGECPDD